MWPMATVFACMYAILNTLHTVNKIFFFFGKVTLLADKGLQPNTTMSKLSFDK